MSRLAKTLLTGACQYGCAALFARAAKQQWCMLFFHIQVTRMISFDFGATDWLCSIFVFLSTQSENVFVLPTILLRRPHYGYSHNTHYYLSQNSHLLPKFGPLQHRHAPQWGGLIRTFQPKCFNSHEGKKREKNGKSKTGLTTKLYPQATFYLTNMALVTHLISIMLLFSLQRDSHAH